MLLDDSPVEMKLLTNGIYRSSWPEKSAADLMPAAGVPA
jgi:hypothetical protein